MTYVTNEEQTRTYVRIGRPIQTTKADAGPDLKEPQDSNRKMRYPILTSQLQLSTFSWERHTDPSPEVSPAETVHGMTGGLGLPSSEFPTLLPA